MDEDLEQALAPARTIDLVRLDIQKTTAAHADNASQADGQQCPARGLGDILWRDVLRSYARYRRVIGIRIVKLSFQERVNRSDCGRPTTEPDFTTAGCL